MTNRFSTLLRSMPLRLALGLVLLFSVVSLVSLAASYLVTQRSFDQALRDDLKQDMAGFRAAPSASALAALVEAEARETDPERVVLSFLAPNRRHYGNAMIGRDAEGYRIVSVAQDNPQVPGRFLAFTESLHGGQLTVARSRAEIDALRGVFLNILGLSLLPTILIALYGGLYLARRSARHVAVVGNTLDQLTSGDLEARVGPVTNWSDDFAQIGTKIDQMAQAQEASVAALRQVSSDIAHDLKTPIQRVAVHLDELSRRSDPDDPSWGLVERARGELDGIVSVFHSLLQIAQIEAGTPRSRFASVDLSDLIKTCIELYEPSARETGHRLVADISLNAVPRVNGDRSLLLQLLANLIENALRYTPARTRIVVSLTAEDGTITLGVADNGQGIPEGEFENVLQRLYRLDQSRMTPGSGLGLSLVSVVAKLHGARLILSDNDPGLLVSIVFSGMPDAGPARHST
jgi:signal transduction histidine kinase